MAQSGTKRCQIDEGKHLYRKNIIVLPQERQTFLETKLRQLADSMASYGLLTPLKIARFDQDGFNNYLKYSGQLHGKNLKPEHYVQLKTGGFYYVLIAGECRVRSFDLLTSKGCSSCIEEKGLGNCRHSKAKFPGQRLRCDIYVDPAPALAREIQVAENIKSDVPPHEEAKFIHSLFMMYRLEDPHFSITQLAKRISRSPDTVGRMIRYCDLPPIIIEAVEKGYLKYGYACEMGRLKPHFNEATLEQELSFIISEGPNLTLPKYNKRVSERINSLIQLDLTQLMEFSVEKEATDAWRRRLKKQTGEGIAETNRYFQGLEFLCRKELMTLSDSPMLDGNNLKLAKSAINQLTLCLGVVEETISILENIGIPHLSALVKALGKIQKKNPTELSQESEKLLVEITRLANELGKVKSLR